MLLPRLALLGLGAVVVDAFRDTSPFFLFSTSELLASSSEIQSADSLTSDISSQLSSCPSDFYLLVSQPGVHITDYASKRSTPKLRQQMQGKNKRVRSSFIVREVVGEVDVRKIQAVLEERCNAVMTEIDASTGSFALYDMMPRTLSISFSSPPTTGLRKESILDNDAFLASIIDMLPSPNFTVIYTTSSANVLPEFEHQEPGTYEMDDSYQAPLHMDLKRDFNVRESATDNSTMSKAPLFDKYQFLSPGIFMGFGVGFILLFILYVAVTGVASLQVSYAAFDKENGPAAQKKQQ